MKYVQRLLTICAVLVCATASIHCGQQTPRSEGPQDPPTEFTQKNPPFRGTQVIAPSIQNAQSGRPAFSWKANNQPTVVVAVFRNNLQFDQRINSISNLHQLVWMWHNGLRTGRDGAVKFSDGFEPGIEELGVNTIDPEWAPNTLTAGKYVWAVWAMDENGDVVASSYELLFSVN